MYVVAVGPTLGQTPLNSGNIFHALKAESGAEPDSFLQSSFSTTSYILYSVVCIWNATHEIRSAFSLRLVSS